MKQEVFKKYIKKNADKSQKSNTRKMTRLGTHEANTYTKNNMNLPTYEELRAASSTRDESKTIQKGADKAQTNDEESG